MYNLNYDMFSNISIPKDVLGRTLVEMGKENDRLVVLSSDVSRSCNVDLFQDVFPNRFFEMGIAEQNTVSIAGGLAAEGFLPVYVALAIFSCGMTWPQARQVCNANLNVKIIGTHAGVDDGQDGTGHHATEDMAIYRAIPRMTVLTASDEVEVAAAIKAMAKFVGPTYLRIAREEQPIFHKKNYVYEIGKAEYICDDGNDFAIIFEGTALKQALRGFLDAEKEGKKGKLISVRSIKPIDRETIKKVADEVMTIVTVENHNVIGGLYDSVLECLTEKKYNAIVKPIAFMDVFTESGVPADIKAKYGLTSEKIVEKIMD